MPELWEEHDFEEVENKMICNVRYWKVLETAPIICIVCMFEKCSLACRQTRPNCWWRLYLN